MSAVTPGRPAITLAVLTASMFSRFTFTGVIAALLVELSRELSMAVPTVGQLFTFASVTWAFLAPTIGPFSDRIGHKRMMVIGLTVCGASALGYGLSWDFLSLISFSILYGVGGAISGPNTFACVGDYFPARTHGRAMAVVHSGAPVASLAGVPAGALVAGILGWRPAFLLLAIFMICTALAAIFVLPPSRLQRAAPSFSYLASFAEAFRQKTLLPLVTANTLLEASFWAIGTYLAAFLIQSYSLTVAQVAPFLSVIAVGQLAGMLAGGPLADRLDKTRICSTTQALAGAVSILLMLLTRDVWLSVSLGALFMALYSSNRPAFLALVVSMSSTVRGTVMGLQAVSMQLGRALGTMAGGLVLGMFGYSYLGLISLALSLLASATFIYVAHLLRKDSTMTSHGGTARN